MGLFDAFIFVGVDSLARLSALVGLCCKALVALGVFVQDCNDAQMRVTSDHHRPYLIDHAGLVCLNEELASTFCHAFETDSSKFATDAPRPHAVSGRSDNLNDIDESPLVDINSNVNNNLNNNRNSNSNCNSSSSADGLSRSIKDRAVRTLPPVPGSTASTGLRPLLGCLEAALFLSSTGILAMQSQEHRVRVMGLSEQLANWATFALFVSFA
jgi:hypothetical protein